MNDVGTVFFFFSFRTCFQNSCLSEQDIFNLVYRMVVIKRSETEDH